MSSEESPRKRPRLDGGYVSSPSPSPIRFGPMTAIRATGASIGAVVLYDPSPVKQGPVR